MSEDNEYHTRTLHNNQEEEVRSVRNEFYNYFIYIYLDIETKVLNDLDEKVRRMAEIIIEKPLLQKVMYTLEKPSEVLAFAFYILFISSHA